jgi:hypothetical protein
MTGTSITATERARLDLLVRLTGELFVMDGDTPIGWSSWDPSQREAYLAGVEEGKVDRGLTRTGASRRRR